MKTRNKIWIGLILMLAIFLAGFVPQYLETRRVRSQLRAGNERIMSLEHDLAMAELRDLAGLLLLETLRQNYGSASEYATRYFESIQQTIQDTLDPSLKAELEELLARRDTITAALAQGDPSSALTLQQLYRRTYEVTN